MPSKEFSDSPKRSRIVHILNSCLAIHLEYGPLPDLEADQMNRYHDLDAETWKFQCGYLVYQSFVDVNSKCHWNKSLLEAILSLQYLGYVSPGVLLVTSSPKSLEAVRAAWGRKVLKSPKGYRIYLVCDLESCVAKSVPQSQFTPLPEALCWVICELTNASKKAHMKTIKSYLQSRFSDISIPKDEIVHSTLGNLIKERKLYHTNEGYFIVTPETYKKKRQVTPKERPLLLSNDEALLIVHSTPVKENSGISTRSVQTDLADIIYGGTPTDKILFPHIPSDDSEADFKPRLDRFASLRLQKATSNREMVSNSSLFSNLSSVSESLVDLSHLKTDITSEDEKNSVLKRFLKKSGLKKKPGIINFSAQFPPNEWFDPNVKILHSVGAQTKIPKPRMSPGLSPRVRGMVAYRSTSSSKMSAKPLDPKKCRSASLPRRIPSRAQELRSKPPNDLTSELMVSEANGVASGSLEESSGASDPCDLNLKLPAAKLKSPNKFSTLPKLSPSSKHSSKRRAKPSPHKLHKDQSERSCSQDFISSQPQLSEVKFTVDAKMCPSSPTTKQQSAKTPNVVAYTEKVNHSPIKDKVKLCLNKSSLRLNLNDKNCAGDTKKTCAVSKDDSQVKTMSVEELIFIPMIEGKDIMKSEPIIAPKLIPDGKKIFASPESTSLSSDNEEEIQEKVNVGDADSFRSYPSLADFDITFKSITGKRLLQGSINSIDTLVEINMRAEESNKKNFGVI